MSEFFNEISWRKFIATEFIATAGVSGGEVLFS
jgi:hypothetical protein